MDFLYRGFVCFSGALVGWHLPVPKVLYALLALMALDILSGLVAAGMKGKIASKESFYGTAQKALQIILVMATAWMAWGLNLPLEIASAVAGAFCVTEMISIVENARAVGVPVPDFLVNLLEKLRAGQEDESK